MARKGRADRSEGGAARGAARRAGPRGKARAAPGERPLWLPLGIRLVYEDDDLIVVDKPPGVLSATPPDARSSPSVFQVLKERMRGAARGGRGGRTQRGAGRTPDVWIVHRLDREASGLLAFAKTRRAFEGLKEDLRARRVERRYLAVVEGEITEATERRSDGATEVVTDGDAGVVRSFIVELQGGGVQSVPVDRFRGETVGPAGAAEGEDEGSGRLAVTHYRALCAGDGRSVVELRLDTGRKHQIRAHMRDIGHPVVGDRRYGAAPAGPTSRKKRGRKSAGTGVSDPRGRLMLHAGWLAFAHPATGAPLRFVSPPPAWWWRLAGSQAVAPYAGEGEASAPAPTAASGAGAAVPTPARADRRDTGWDAVAEWYDDLIDERKSDHYVDVILPGTLRLLGAERGQRVLDVACGQGVLARELSARGVDVVGVDASARLVELARQRSKGAAGPGHAAGATRFEVGDARELERLGLGLFDSAACVMALMNIDPIAPALRGVAASLKPGGVFVAVMLHPAFRSARQTSWGWEKQPDGSQRQYRRVDGYLSPAQARIVQNPGEVAAGKPAVETWSFHRPLQAYVRAFAEAGLLIDALEEWPSRRVSDSGPRAAEENRARREIPMFAALRARRAAGE